MKKIISLILSFLLISCICPALGVYAENGDYAKILSYDYDNSSGDIIKEESHLSFRTGHWTEYKYVADEAGIYTLEIAIGSSALSKDSMKFLITVNGESFYAYLSPTGDYGRIRTRYGGRVNLNAGENTIRITNEHTACYFDYITLQRRETQITDLADIKATDYIYGGESGVKEENGCITLSESDWLVYDIETEGGLYRFDFTAKSEGKAYGYVSQDSISSGTFNIKDSGAEYANSTAFLNLKEGRSELKLFLSSGNISLESFSLTKVNEEDFEDFFEGFNNAKSMQMVKEALDAYGLEIPSGIFYGDIIYDRLINNSYERPEDIIEAFENICYEEKTSPTVTPYIGKIKVNKLMSGNMSFLVKGERLRKDIKVIVALYKENQLYKIAEGINEGVDLTIPLGKIEVKSSDNVKIKMMFWESFENAVPKSAVSEVYEEIFVAPNGTASGNGTKANPFNSIKAAKEKAAELSENQSGDIVVNIAPGYYFLSETEVFEPAHSGRNGHNIIYRGDSENQPIISGGIEVNGWEEVENGIYKAKVPAVSDTRTFYIDDKPAVRAKSSKKYTVSSIDADNAALTVNNANFPDLQNPENAEAVFNISWANKRIPIEKIEKTDASKIFLEPDVFAAAADNSSNIGIAAQKTFYIENDLSLLDEAGEFYFDKNTSEIYYKPRYEGELLNSGFIPVTEGLLEISGISTSQKTENIIFENLNFRYGAWNDTNSLGFCSLQADQYKDSDDVIKRLHSQIRVNMADEIQIKNSKFEFFGSSAISLEDSVTNTKITQNMIKDISGTAIVIGSWDRNLIGDEENMCREISVSDNVIRRIGNEYFSSPAISVYYENSVNISHNDISDVPYTGVSVGWGWGTYDIIGTGNINVTNNKISGVCSSDLWDGAHVYTLGHLKDSRISDNYFGKSDKSDYGGVYTDSGTAYLNVYNNVFDGANKWFFTGWYLTHNMNVYDNYATSSNYQTRGENNSYEDAVLINDINSNQAAYSIYENAGITWDCDDSEMKIFNLTATEKILDAEDYTRNGATKPQISSDSLVLESGTRVEYDIMAEEGLYDIYLTSGGISDAKVWCTVNDDPIKQINIKASNDENKFVITAYLKDGVNTLNLGALSGTLYAKEISFKINDGERIAPPLLNYTDAHSIQPEGSHLSFQPGDWIEYEISTNEAGWYNFYAVVTNPSSWGIKVTANDSLAPDIQKTMSAVSGSEIPVLVDRIYLEKGSNKVNIANGGGYYYFDGCIFEKNSSDLSTISVEIPATKYFVGYSAYGIGTGNTIHNDIKWEGGNLSFQPNDYAEYIVYAKQGGTYKLSILMGCPSEMRTQISINGVVAFNSTNRTGKNDYSTQYFDIGNVQLKEGKNVIRIKNTKGSRYFNAFKLTKVG